MEGQGQGRGALSERWKRLGQILIDAGLITPEQLRTALEVKRETGGRLGEVLVRLGYVSEVDIARALAEQFQLPFVDRAALDLDPAVARRIGPEMARRNGVLPVREVGDTVVVATSDPLNVFVLDEVRRLIGRSIRPVVVTERTLLQLIEEAFAPGRAEAGGGGVGVRDAEEGPVIRLADELIRRAVQERASDIHVEPLEDRVRVRFRIDGVLHETMSLPKAVHAPLVSRFKIMAGMDIAERRLPQDGRIRMRVGDEEIDLRVSTLPTVYGEKIQFRILPLSRLVFELDELGFDPDTLATYRRLLERPFGMILVTGPTGSGKTTTLMASLRVLNTVERNVITIEDPVEYRLPGVNQTQINPKAGYTFASGLRAFLRQDPDVIMVGEIRDYETAEIAVRAALTGHLLLSTLHTNTAAWAPVRLIDMGVEPYLVGSALAAVIGQRLVRTLCPRCREPYPLPPDAPERLLLPLPQGPVQLWRPVGCDHCNGTGYRGRTGVFELFLVTPEIRERIVARTPATELERLAIAAGMRTMVEDGVRKALAGVTSLSEVLRLVYQDDGRPPAARGDAREVTVSA